VSAALDRPMARHGRDPGQGTGYRPHRRRPRRGMSPSV